METGNMTTRYDEDTLRDILAYLCSKRYTNRKHGSKEGERQAEHCAKYVTKGTGIQAGKHDRELRRRHSVQSIHTY